MAETELRKTITKETFDLATELMFRAVMENHPNPGDLRNPEVDGITFHEKGYRLHKDVWRFLAKCDESEFAAGEYQPGAGAFTAFQVGFTAGFAAAEVAAEEKDNE
jgi:hypothetical protein